MKGSDYQKQTHGNMLANTLSISANNLQNDYKVDTVTNTGGFDSGASSDGGDGGGGE